MNDYPRQLKKNDDHRWDFLSGALPNKINPTDIDLSYERRGRFLVLEGKREGAETSTGQKRYFDALAAVPQFVVVHFYGVPPDEVMSFARWGQEPQPGNTDELRASVRRWYDWVERQP